MKTFFAALLLSVTLASQATELVKLHDGSVAKCESRIDVARHGLSGVYRPLDITKNSMNIEFLRCTEREGKFAFVRDFSFESRKVSPLIAPERKLVVERRKVSLMLVNGKGNLVDQQLLTKEADGIYSVEFNMISAKDKPIEMFVQSRYKLIDAETGSVIDEGLESLGSFRLLAK